MKTIEQTNKYLSSCIFDDDDWERVLSFCREQLGGGNVHRPRRGKYYATFADFATWFNHLPGQGEIVRVGGVIGIVGQCTPLEYTLCAYTGQNGQLIQKDMTVLPQHIQPCTQDELESFRAKMFDVKVSYSVSIGMLTKQYIPENGEFVAVKFLRNTKYGIFNCVTSSSYVFYYLDGVTGEASVPVGECEIEGATSKESLGMLERLSRLGVMWSSKERKLIPVPKRAAFGEKYWYINDKFYICQAKDMQTPIHKGRYKNGNYFTSYGEALVFLKRLKDLCAEMNKGLDL